MNKTFESKLRIGGKRGRAIRQLLWEIDAINDRIGRIQDASCLTLDDIRRLHDEWKAEGGTA